MSRRRQTAKASMQMPLLPFLAVLICTMGALLTLLVIVVQRAKAADSAAEPAIAEPARAAEPAATADVQTIHRRIAELSATLHETSKQAETLAWQADQLAASRSKTLEDLRRREAELSHVEQELRDLAAEIEAVQDEVAALEKADADPSENAAARRRYLADLTTQLEQVAAEVKAAQEEASRGQRSYAIIPYRGASGTTRRPIYIECRHDRLILQPEGIALTDCDFREPILPGNPLAAALRAKREYWSRLAGGATSNERAYPLMIVRPGGAGTFVAARSAMNGWDSEFGYELVGDIDLAYPQADPQLAALLKEVVTAARARRERLELAAPGRFQPQESGGVGHGALTVSPGHGGFVPYGGNGTTSAAQARREAMNRTADQTLGSGGFAAAAGREREPGPGGNDAHGKGDSQVAQRHGQASRRREGSDGITPAPAATGEASHGAAPGASGQAGSARPGAAAGPNLLGGQATAGQEGQERPFGRETPVAQSRGRDWALPKKASHAMGITRPLRMDVYADRVMIVSDRAGVASREVRLPGATRSSVDEVVAAIWDHVDRWGIAGPGMYWKPVLRIGVAADGAQRYRELADLLHGSGLSVDVEEGR